MFATILLFFLLCFPLCLIIFSIFLSFRKTVVVNSNQSDINGNDNSFTTVQTPKINLV